MAQAKIGLMVPVDLRTRAVAGGVGVEINYPIEIESLYLKAAVNGYAKPVRRFEREALVLKLKRRFQAELLYKVVDFHHPFKQLLGAFVI